jgi:L-ascorbate metabolism protein UlaG (beta-lactamase superfamily)
MSTAAPPKRGGPGAAGVNFTWFGTDSGEITFGNTMILFDPWFSGFDLRAIFGDPANLNLWVKEARQVSPKSKIVVLKVFESYAA